MLRPSFNVVLPFIAAWLAIGAQSSPVAEGHSIAARSTWEPDEVSATECSWEAPRMAVIRDTLYIDGGYLLYQAKYANGSLGYPTTDGIPQYEDLSTQVRMVNFTHPFDTTQNETGIFQIMNKTNGAGNNLYFDFFDGAMFANDGEYYLYGGLDPGTNAFPNSGSSYLAAQNVQGYEAFQYGTQRQSWSPGFVQETLSTGVTRYVTAGAGASVPSENLGFYFSGLRSPTWGEINAGGDNTTQATELANTLITVDLSVMRNEKWSNDTLPTSAPGRAGGELVWIPTASQGALVALGGVINPESASVTPLSDSQISASKAKSPTFMSTVSVYDVSGKKWYQQNTTGDTPPQLTQFCAVVGSAQDGTSHNIYIYGGYDGLNSTSDTSDDVYILSIPSFIWIKASTGNSTHGRRHHRCVTPYPDQMFVLGGVAKFPDGLGVNCLDAGVLQIYNINSLKWQNTYDPKTWSPYQVPAVVTAKIGGDGNGTARTLGPNSWSSSDLSALFSTAYTKTIPTHYPYSSIASTALPTRSTVAVNGNGGGGTPSWVIPVVVVIVVLLLLTIATAAFLLFKRHKYIKMYGTSDAGGSANTEHRVLAWMRGTPPVRSNTKGSSDTETSEVVSSGRTALNSPSEDRDDQPDIAERHEADAAREFYELPGNSLPSELPITHQTALTPPPRNPDLPRRSPSSGVPRPESPTGGALPAFPPPAAVPQHSHSHSRSISSDLGPNSPSSATREDMQSPVSPPESVRASNGSSLVGQGGPGDRTRRVSNFEEILE